MATTYAYKACYSYEERNRHYVQFNISPASGSTIYPGATIKITGQAYNAEAKMTEIGMSLAINEVGGLDPGLNNTDLTIIKKSVPKGTLTSFTLTFKVTPAMWSAAKPGIWGDSCWPVPGMWADGWLDTYIGTVPHYVMNLASPSSPRIWNPEIVDLNPAQSLDAFGAYAAFYNTLQYRATVERDVTTYPINKVYHTLTVKDSGGNVLHTLTQTTDSDSLVINLPEFGQAGTYRIDIDCVDAFGGTGGGMALWITVAAYSPPNITSCSFERYQEVQTDTGRAHEASPEGEYIWLNLDATVAAVNQRNAWTATLTAWRKERPEIAATAGSAVYEDTAGALRTVSTWALAGSDGTHIELSRDEDNLSDEMVLSSAYDWCLRLTITDALGNSVTLLVDDDIRKDSAILDVEPHGVAVGMRSTGGAGDEKFECAWPAAFGDDMAVGAGALLKVISFQVFSGETIASQGVKTGTYTISASDLDSNWTPVAIAGFNTDTRYAIVYDVRLSADNPRTVRYGVYNVRTSASITCAMRVYVLCVRTSL